MKKILLSLVVLCAALSVSAKKVVLEDLTFTFKGPWDWQQVEFPSEVKDATGYTHLIAYISEATTTANVIAQIGWNATEEIYKFQFQNATSVGENYVIINISDAGEDIVSMGNFCIMSNAGGAGTIKLSEVAYLTQEEYDEIHAAELSKPYNETVKEPGDVTIAGGGYGWNGSIWLDKVFNERAKNYVVEIASTPQPIAIVVKFGDADGQLVNIPIGASTTAQTVVVPFPEGSTYVQQFAIQNFTKNILGDIEPGDFVAVIPKIYITSEDIESNVVEPADPSKTEKLYVVVDEAGSWATSASSELTKGEDGNYVGVVEVEDQYNGNGWFAIVGDTSADNLTKTQLSVSDEWGTLDEAGTIVCGVNNSFKLPAGSYLVTVSIAEKTILIQDAATGINVVATSVAKTGKRLENGSVVIYKNGKKYNAAGAVVK